MKIYFFNIYISFYSIFIVNAYKCNFSININDSKLIRFERDPLDCRVFHICAFNRTYTLACVKGYYFDSIKNICNFENLVDCNAPPDTLVFETFNNNESNVSSIENVRVGEVSSIVFESMEDEYDSIEASSEDEDEEEEQDGEENNDEDEIVYDSQKNYEKKATLSALLTASIKSSGTLTITAPKTTTTITTTTSTTSTVTTTSTVSTSTSIPFTTTTDKMDLTTIEPLVIIQDLTTAPIIILNRSNNSSKKNFNLFNLKKYKRLTIYSATVVVGSN